MTLILNWIKANWLIVSLCGLMIVCLPTVIMITEGMKASSHEIVSKRARDTISSIKRVERTSVTIKPLMPGVPSHEETRTINKAVLDDYKPSREQIKEDADRIILQATATNRSGKEGQLVPGLLPSPRTQSEDLPFKIHAAYIAAHLRLLEELNAGMPIDPQDLTLHLTDFEGSFRRSELNVEPDEGLTDEEAKRLAEAMTRARISMYADRASEISTYADQSVFNLEDWGFANDKPDDVKMYDWQHTYWLHSDLVRAIVAANTPQGASEPSAVTAEQGSVVKRILSIRARRLDDGIRRSARETGGRGGSSEGAMTGFGSEYGEMSGGEYGGGEYGAPLTGKAAVFAEGATPRGAPRGAPTGSRPKEPPKNDDPSKPFEPDYSRSITGRETTAMFDVRIVDVVLIVDSERIIDLLDALNKASFMTVRGCKMTRVNQYDELHRGFFYGSDSIVQLDLRIETVWLRDWTSELMPEAVKDMFGMNDQDDTSDDRDDKSKKKKADPPGR